MEGEEKERNWDERRRRKGNTGKMMGLDVMASSENLDPRDQRREERFGGRTREKGADGCGSFLRRLELLWRMRREFTLIL